MKGVYEVNIQESRNSLLSKILLIGIIFVLLGLIITVLFIFLSAGNKKESKYNGSELLEQEIDNKENQSNLGTVIENGTRGFEAVSSGDSVDESWIMDEELINCLPGGLLEGCEEIFKNPNIGDRCVGLGDLTNDCFYTTAIINKNSEFCESIDNKTMKDNCNNDLSLLAEPNISV